MHDPFLSFRLPRMRRQWRPDSVRRRNRLAGGRRARRRRRGAVRGGLRAMAWCVCAGRGRGRGHTAGRVREAHAADRCARRFAVRGFCLGPSGHRVGNAGCARLGERDARAGSARPRGNRSGLRAALPVAATRHARRAVPGRRGKRGYSRDCRRRRNSSAHRLRGRIGSFRQPADGGLLVGRCTRTSIRIRTRDCACSHARRRQGGRVRPPCAVRHAGRRHGGRIHRVPARAWPNGRRDSRARSAALGVGGCFAHDVFSRDDRRCVRVTGCGRARPRRARRERRVAGRAPE